MGIYDKNKGSVFLIVIFVIALMAAVVTGILQINTEQIQLMRNHIGASKAMAISEAGLNDAFSRLRNDPNWTDGFSDKSFSGGNYSVTVTGTLPELTLTSTGTTAQSYTTNLEADVTVGSESPYVVRIDELRVNE